MTTRTYAKTDSGSSTDGCRNKLLNISIVSAEASDFITVKRKSSSEPLLIRPTLHITQITPFGELKTTTANRIAEYIQEHRKGHPFYKVSSVTAPAIAGSIDEKFRVTPPLSANFLNGTIIVDEFKTNSTEKSDAIGAALDAVENEESSRAMARQPKTPLKSSPKEAIQYEIKNGRLHFWGLRCNWIFLTAKHLEMNRSLPMAMLLSRTVPIKFNPSWEELKAIDDNPDLLFKSLNLQLPKLETIDNPIYLEIRDYVEKNLRQNKIPPNYFFRTVNDCLRAYVFSGYQHDWNLYDYILMNKTMFVSDCEKQGFDLAEIEMQSAVISQLKQADLRYSRTHLIKYQ
jgi:hypothetical protein